VSLSGSCGYTSHPENFYTTATQRQRAKPTILTQKQTNAKFNQSNIDPKWWFPKIGVAMVPLNPSNHQLSIIRRETSKRKCHINTGVVLMHEAIWCGCWSISLQAPILTGAEGISQWKTEVDGHEHCTTFKKNSRDPRGSVIPDLSLSLFLLRHLQLTRAKGVQHTMTISYNHFQPLKTEPERSISTPLRLSSWMCIPTIITHGHSLTHCRLGCIPKDCSTHANTRGRDKTE
jgi:hypothetical protein